MWKDERKKFVLNVILLEISFDEDIKAILSNTFFVPP